MLTFRRINNFLKRPEKLFAFLGYRGFFNWLPDKPYLKLTFWGKTGKKLNLDNPQTFNEKLQWIKLYDRKPEYSIYADKYAVRSYIKEVIGDEYLIPLIAVYDTVDEINWDLLPDQFVLKCTHGSGANIICSKKNELNVDDAKKNLEKWMKKNFYWYGREWPYKHIRPRIICEPFISENSQIPDDYKVMCFNGEAKVVQVHSDRFIEHKVDYYDNKWGKMSLPDRGVTQSNKVHTEPICLEKMLQLSEQLAANIPQVRIDWFIINNQLYFGEMTFFDDSGFIDWVYEKDNCLLGSWIELPQKPL